MSSSSQPSTIQEDEVSDIGKLEHGLSVVSRKYDSDNKGFLTPAEKRLREMDTQNKGYLDNAQVAGLMDRSLKLEASNALLKKYILILFVVVVVSGIANIATAIAVAVLAKETSVQSGSGLMVLKDDTSKGVMTVSSGESHTVQTDPTTGTGCVSVDELTNMFLSMSQGTPTTVMMVSNSSPGDGSDSVVGTTRAVRLQATGSFYNDTHVCFKDEENNLLCGRLGGSQCGNDADENVPDDRRLRQLSHQFHAKKFHADIQQQKRRHLADSFAECYGLCMYEYDDPGLCIVLCDSMWAVWPEQFSEKIRNKARSIVWPSPCDC